MNNYLYCIYVLFIMILMFSFNKHVCHDCLDFFSHPKTVRLPVVFFFLHSLAVICFQTETERRLSSRLLPVGGTV